MEKPIIISIAALSLSMLSIGFNIYQYKKSKMISLLEKSNKILNGLLNIQTKVFNLSQLLNNSDEDIKESYTSLGYERDIKKLISFIGNKSTFEQLIAIEKQAMKIENELDIFIKEIEIKNEENGKIIKQGFIKLREIGGIDS